MAAEAAAAIAQQKVQSLPYRGTASGATFKSKHLKIKAKTEGFLQNLKKI